MSPLLLEPEDTMDTNITKMTLEAIVRMCRTEHDTYNDLAKAHYCDASQARKYYALADHWWAEYKKAKKNLLDFETKLRGEGQR